MTFGPAWSLICHTQWWQQQHDDVMAWKHDPHYWDFGNNNHDKDFLMSAMAYFLCPRRWTSNWVARDLSPLNTLRPRQNGRHFTDDIFKCIFLNENVWIPVKITLKFVPKCLINNNPTLVQIMVWRRSGDKPLSEPMMVSLPTLCVIRPPCGTNVIIFS